MKNTVRLAGFACASLLFVTACSGGLEPGWTSDKEKSEISITLGIPSSSEASVSSGSGERAIIQGGGYLYIQTDSQGESKLYGPWQVASGESVHTSDIPSGTYESIHFVYLEALKPDTKPILTSTEFSTFDAALDDYLVSTGGNASAASWGVKEGVTIVAGKINEMAVTLLPLTRECLDTSAANAVYALPPSPSAVSRRFIKLTGIASNLDSWLAITSLTATVTNRSASSSASIGTLALYGTGGALLTAKRFSPNPLPSEQSGSVIADYPTDKPSEVYLYIEYQAESLEVSFIRTTVDSRLTQYTYYVGDDSATGSGKDASAPCSFAAALSGIAGSSYITESAYATILLTKNIDVSPSAGYMVTRPLMLSSVDGSTFAITLGSPVSGALFTVGDAANGVPGKFTLSNAGILGGGTGRMASGGLVRVDDGTFIMASGATLADNTSTVSGGAVRVMTGAANLTMNGGSIRDCSATVGGAVYLGSGEFVLAGGSIYGCSSTVASGGAVFLDGGVFGMTGGSIHDSAAIDTGGAVALAGGSFTMSGGEIYSCTAPSGSAVYAKSAALVTLKGTGVIGKSGSPNVSTSTVASGGGAVAVAEGATFILESGSVSGNTAQAQGGGVYVGNAGILKIIGGSITNNSAAGVAGGVYVASGGELDLSAAPGTSITGNQAGKLAGGVLLGEGATRVGPSDWSVAVNNNKTIVGGASVNILPDVARLKSVATQTALAAAIAYTDEPVYAVLSANIVLTSTMTVSRPLAIGAATDGLSLVRSGSLLVSLLTADSGGNLSLCDGLAVDGNNMSSVYSPMVLVATGGVLNLSGNARLIKGYNNSNSTGSEPGGAVLVSGGTFNMYSGTIGGSSTNKNQSNDGGGVFVKNGTFNLYGGEISYNEVITGNGGAGIYGTGTSELNLYGGLIAKNVVVATSGSGGGLYADGGVVRLTASSTVKISGNTSTMYGGGVCLINNAEFQMLGGTIGGDSPVDANTANNGGGGAYIATTGQKCILSGGAIAYNTTQSSGGGMYIAGSGMYFTLNGTASISHNTAVFNGGGLYFANGCMAANGCTVAELSPTIANNHVNATGLDVGPGVFIDNVSTVYDAFLAVMSIFSGNTEGNDALQDIYMMI